ncbi:MAG TPA: hypothetical protein HA257_04950 [Candidatus Methanoperedenaceae archaeon]|nr:hypothetical protein [Candidatus Methanoperedenaceae archaeon]
MTEYRLRKRYVKPAEGEFVPIVFVELTRRTVGWSPGLRKSVYVDGDTTDLKRVREVNVLKVINMLSGNISEIELTDEEMAQFDEVYAELQERGGQVVYTRKKKDRGTIAFFELREPGKKEKTEVHRALLSDRLS